MDCPRFGEKCRFGDKCKHTSKNVSSMSDDEKIARKNIKKAKLLLEKSKKDLERCRKRSTFGWHDHLVDFSFSKAPRYLKDHYTISIKGRNTRACLYAGCCSNQIFCDSDFMKTYVSESSKDLTIADFTDWLSELIVTKTRQNYRYSDDHFIVYITGFKGHRDDGWYWTKRWPTVEEAMSMLVLDDKFGFGYRHHHVLGAGS